MARRYNGTNQLSTATGVSYLSGSVAAFTVSFWLRPAALAVGLSNKHVLRVGTGASYWGFLFDYVENSVEYFQTGTPSPNPRTGSACVLDLLDVAFGARLLYRHAAAGGEWAFWKNGTKTVISAAIGFTLPTLSGNTLLASSGIADFLNGDLAEVAIWNAALSDSECALVTTGTAPDMIRRASLLAYWPLRGNTASEPNYATASGATLAAMVGSNTPTSAPHPDVYGAPAMVGRTPEPVWLATLLHAGGTRRVSTVEVGAPARELDYLGGSFQGRLLREPTSSAALGDSLSGVVQAGEIELEILNTADPGWTDIDEKGATPWRDTPVVVERFDRATFELVEEFSGIVHGVRKRGSRLLLRCSGQDLATLARLVPTAIIDPDLFPSSTKGADVGRTLPVVFGRDVPVRLRAIGFDDTAANGHDPGGTDFVCAVGTDARVEAVYSDVNADAAGLEARTEWVSAATDGGHPVKTSGSTFTIDAGYDDIYYEGLHLRWRDTESEADPVTYPGGYKSSFVTDYNATTHVVTIFNTDIGTSPHDWELSAVYVVEQGRYQLSGGGPFLTTIRFLENPPALLGRISTPLENPSLVAEALLSNADWSVGKAVNAASFAAGAAQLNAIGGAALRVAGELGFGGSQRVLGEVLNEILSFQGGRTWWSARHAEWFVRWDTAPLPSVLTLTEGGAENNILDLGDWEFTDTAVARDRLRLNYGIEGRAAERGAQFIPAQYTAFITAPVFTSQGFGQEGAPITSQWIREFATASRVLAYVAKTQRYSDGALPVTANYDGRRVKVGDVVTVNSARLGLSGVLMRVKAITARTLATTRMVLVGYNAAIHTYDSGDTDVAPTDPDRDTRVRPPGGTRNLLQVGDFSITQRTQALADGELSFPGLVISNVARLTSLGVVADPGTEGGRYLQVVTASVTPNLFNFAFVNQGSFAEWAEAYPPVLGGQRYAFSIFCDRAAGWRVRILWFTAAGTYGGEIHYPLALKALAETNGLGWRRYFTPVRMPDTAALCTPFIECYQVGTFKFDAAQLELITGRIVRPSRWTLGAPFGIDPARWNPGRQTVIPAGTAGLGSATDHFGPVTITVGGGGPHLYVESSTAIPAEVAIEMVRVKVTTAFTGTGISKIGVGYDADPTAWGTCPLTLDGKNTARYLTTSVLKPSTTKIRLTALDANDEPVTGGNGFSTGVLTAYASYREFIAYT